MKAIKKLVYTVSAISSISFTSTVSFASETENDVKLFIPSRSYYAKYISENASLDSDMVQYVWLRLFSEETNWNADASYYSAGYNSWTEKYYSDYIGADGIIYSSKGAQVTYNTDFDGFLYQTLNHNDDFIINWINNNPTVFKKYCRDVKSHPIFAKAIIDMTSDSDANANFLGDGMYASNNLFLRGAASTASNKHKGNGSGAKWSESAPKAFSYDIDILRVLGNNYSKLLDTQKAWVRTYFEWMVSDYISNRAGSLAAESRELLNMIAVSAEAFNSSDPQLFFDHCIANRDVNVGDFIVNSASANGQKDTLFTGTKDISSNNDMSIIWDMSDGDCYYTNKNWNGYRTPAGQTADNDYDWLCHRICFDKNAYWAKLRNLISSNPITSAQIENWIMRYNAKSPATGSNSFAAAIAKSGQTETENINHSTWSGCGRKTPEPVIAGDGSIDHYRERSFWCPTHGTTGSWKKNKPIGVNKIAFDVPTSGVNVDSTITYRIYDNSTGDTIASTSEAKKDSVITLPAKYVWSSTIVIEGSTHYRDGNQGLIGNGSCDKSHSGTTTISFTYADVSNCVKIGHVYNWTYNFCDVNGSVIKGDDKTTVPDHCVANGVCANCGHRTEYKDMQLRESANGNSKLFTATFSHASATNLGAKTHTVYSGTAQAGPTIFSPQSNANYLTASSNLLNFGSTNKIIKTYTGNGNSVQLTTSAHGTVSLKSGAITKGALSISVTAEGHHNIYRLVNPISGELNGSRQELMTSSGTTTCTWDLSDYSDDELEGVYVIVEMYSRDENKAGHSIGDVVSCTSTVQFKEIRVTY